MLNFSFFFSSFFSFGIFIPLNNSYANLCQASFLLTIRSAVSLANLLVILPAMSHFLISRLKVSVIKKDVWIARTTGIAGVFGALLIAFASSLGLLIPGGLLLWPIRSIALLTQPRINYICD